MTYAINITPEGKLVMLKSEVSDDLRGGEYYSQRVSHIEPVNPVLRWVFHAIRSRVADNSKLAAFTRRWRCQWQSNLSPVDGPVLGPFSVRSDAIEAEVDWLIDEVFDGQDYRGLAA